ncbi:hypothetical protein DSM106972_001950 [Dulcicalothrix desertica PCC 7102]|uniref:Uncharacterized protein n=1 Tax=Dulcicalothrix desertica PCC 7102 TaxID=232991 RepID=A0A433VU98_9CYAN|nr:hypothetical protein [Dulcicalothrix desertica]RUT09700.1 hypothetical protein DSM106972_001950 [Dulcicalothrix desertica PCC 7102]TWH50898.1 hypothetical protein CAL7102_05246 [Dulcicalothrix desertica PCC 7102]
MNIKSNPNNFRLFKNLSSVIFKVVFPTTVFFIAVLLISRLQGISTNILVGDPNEIAGLPPYAGMISMLGVLFWCASAVICIFTSYILTKNDGLQTRKWSRFLLFSGCITVLMLLDDLFQIHEYYYHPFINLSAFKNSRFVINLFESLFFSIYIVLISIYLLKFKNLFKNTNYPIVIMAILFFVLSVLVDVGTPETMVLHTSIEDGSKLLGIVTWFSYFLDCCYEQIQKLLSNNKKLSSEEITNNIY